ncbi:MAG: hypothetical protein ACREQ4_09980 [Candidatus Binataceae bacterium]
MTNVGKLHAVYCEWCELKMACNCMNGNNQTDGGHIIVLCPRCQVTNLINMIFGGKDYRDELLSKIEHRRAEANPKRLPKRSLRLCGAAKASHD